MSNIELTGQAICNPYLYVCPSDNSAYPTDNDGPNFTKNAALNTLLQNHQVLWYGNSFPDAESDLLQRAHAIHLNGDISALKAILEGN